MSKDEQPTAPDWMELGFSWASGALVLALLVYLAMDAMREISPAAFRVRTEPVVSSGTALHVPVTVDNVGDRAVQSVEVTVTLVTASHDTAKASFTLDWLAGNSTRRGMAVFPRSGASGSRATAEVTGFAVP